jgi:hypothetical protein
MASRRRIIYDLNPNKISFSIPAEPSYSFKGKQPSVSFGTRINILYEAEDGKKYPLILAPKGCQFYSFGIQNDSFAGSSKTTKSMCISINVNDDFSSNENVFCANIYAIYMEARQYVITNADKLNIKVSRSTIDEAFKCPLKEHSKDGNTSMRFYAKLIMGGSSSKVWTKFYDKELQKVAPESLEGIHCTIYPALLFDSLYLWSGSRVSLQCKLSEALVDTGVAFAPSLDMSLLKIND